MPDPQSAKDRKLVLHDRAEWMAAVEVVLKGRSFDETLVSHTRDGLDIQPLYDAARSEPAKSTHVVGSRQRILHGWDVRQSHRGSGSDCHDWILEDLECGVTSAELVLPAAGPVREFIKVALDGVMLDIAPVAIAPHSSIEAARTLFEHGSALASTTGIESWLGLDPLGSVARGEVVDPGESMRSVAEFVAELSLDAPGTRPLTVDTIRYAENGATEAQQLAAAMATGAAYLRALEAVGVSPADGARMIGFRLPATADQFVTMATLRAARRLWARVLQSCGVDPANAPQAQQAVTPVTMYSRRDPWVNMLRATTACLAAGVAGADAITVLPFDSAIGQPSALGRRNARNTQLVLVEESHLSRLVDPSSGSWFIESLTDRLALAGWSEFQSIERRGGMSAVLVDGSFAAEISEKWNSRAADIATRTEPITGVSEFPLIDETPVFATQPTDAESGWPQRRPSAVFEALRDSADRHTVAVGQRPLVYIAALGHLATHGARSTWAVNLLASAGVAAVGAEADGSDSPLEAEARFGDSGSSVAVICSSDAVYRERAVATAVALRESGAEMVALAGDPGDRRAALEAAGVDEFWYVGIDVVAAMKRLHGVLFAGAETEQV